MQLRLVRNKKEEARGAMNEMTRPLRVSDAQSDRLEVTIPAVESAALLQGRRELTIRHGVELYRLRLTASNKLILTK
jgi:hemin uptake protein HemP